MPFPANARLHAAEAPGGLDLVQELLNTRRTGPVGAPRPDLLADGRAATGWAETVLAERGTRVAPLDDGAAGRLREVRDRLVAERSDGDPGPTPGAAAVALSLAGTGAVEVGPADSPDAVAGLVLSEVLLAQARGDWSRLKLCALEICGAAFYDRSRNTSARYHSARCANHVNLTNSRSRARERAS